MGGRILKDADNDQQLKELGYVVFPLLSEVQAKELLNFYFANSQDRNPGMSASAHNTDIGYRKTMSKAIHEAIVPELDNLAVDIRALGGSFITKSAGASGSLAPHQDWNITDEQHYRSFNLWVPLVDTHKGNGAICILPKSHLAGLNFRGPGIPSLCENIMDELWVSMITLTIPAGHALLYDHRLIHASWPNDSTGPRVVAVLGVLENAAPMYIYYGNGNAIDVYSCTPDFFLEHNPNEGPAGLSCIDRVKSNLIAPDAVTALKVLSSGGADIKSFKKTELEGKSAYSSIKKWLSRILN